MKNLFKIKSNSGQMGGMVPAMIGILVVVIVGVAVSIPVIYDVVTRAVNGSASTNITGTAATIIGYFPLLVAVVIIVAIVSVIAFKS